MPVMVTVDINEIALLPVSKSKIKVPAGVKRTPQAGMKTYQFT